MTADHEGKRAIKDSAANDETPTDADIAAAKAAVHWLEEDTPAFLEETHGDAKAAVFDETNGDTTLAASYDGDETLRLPIDEFTAMVVRAGMFWDR